MWDISSWKLFYNDRRKKKDPFYKRLYHHYLIICVMCSFNFLMSRGLILQHPPTHVAPLSTQSVTWSSNGEFSPLPYQLQDQRSKTEITWPYIICFIYWNTSLLIDQGLYKQTSETRSKNIYYTYINKYESKVLILPLSSIFFFFFCYILKLLEGTSVKYKTLKYCVI